MPSEGGAARRVLITGTSGFVASHVAALLMQRGYAVFGLDIREPGIAVPHGLRHYTCDLLDWVETARVLDDVRPDVVLHLAARTDLAARETLEGYAANVEGVDSLCGAIRRVGTVERSICTSTQLVSRIGYRPANDEDFCPTTVYGESKVLTERQVPFNSSRLNNVITPHRTDVERTREVCGPLPYSPGDGIALTAQWLRSALSAPLPAEAHPW